MTDPINNSYNTPGLVLPPSNVVTSRKALSTMSSNGQNVNANSALRKSGAFAFKPDDASKDDGVKLNFDFQHNILDNYDAYSYHWKLFMVDPDASTTGLVHSPDRQIIIAETGVSGVTIDNVSMDSVTVPSVETGTGTSTMFSFELIEPAGAGLIDKIFYQSAALGIGNWVAMPFYLELSFKARDPLSSGTKLTDHELGDLNSIKWLWPVKLSDTKATVTGAGTQYTMKGVVYGDYAQANSPFTLLQNVKLENMRTVGDALSDLQEKLNMDQLISLIGEKSIPDIYEFVVDPAIAGQLVTPSTHRTDSSRNDSMSILDVKDGSFPAGTAIDKIIDSLLAQTDLYQTELVGSQTPGSPKSKPKSGNHSMRKFWRIVTETIPLNFDVVRQDTAKRFVIYVLQYDIGVVESSTSETPTAEESIEFERQRVQEYINKAVIRKRYDYIFTGLNTQVREFDLTINNAFAVSASRFGGVYNNSSMSSIGVHNQSNSEDEAKLAEKIKKSITFINKSKNNLKKSEAEFNEAVEAIERSDISDEKKERYKNLLAIAKSKDRVSSSLESVSLYGGVADEGRFTGMMLSNPVNGRRFVSDVDLGSEKVAKSYDRYNAYTTSKMRPMAVVQGQQDRAVGAGVESSSNSGIQKISALFSTIIHSKYSAAFANIKMKIKGDPFWVYPRPQVKGQERSIYVYDPQNITKSIEEIKKSHILHPGTANVYGTDNFILVRFRTPRVFDNASTIEDDKDKFTDVGVFSGIYRVTNITSYYEKGDFYQEINAIIDPIVNYENIRESVDNAGKNSNRRTVVSNIVAGNKLDDVNVGTRPIPGANNIDEFGRTIWGNLTLGTGEE